MIYDINELVINGNVWPEEFLNGSSIFITNIGVNPDPNIIWAWCGVACVDDVRFKLGKHWMILKQRKDVMDWPKVVRNGSKADIQQMISFRRTEVANMKKPQTPVEEWLVLKSANQNDKDDPALVIS